MINTATISPLSREASKASPKSLLWTGRVLWTLSVPFMLMDAGLHIANPSFVSQASTKLGLPTNLAVPLGVVTLVSLALYLIPRTAVLGALLLTGYLGGAVAIQLRVGGSVPFAAFMGVLLWGALYCRDERVRSLFN